MLVWRKMFAAMQDDFLMGWHHLMAYRQRMLFPSSCVYSFNASCFCISLHCVLPSCLHDSCWSLSNAIVLDEKHRLINISNVAAVVVPLCLVYKTPPLTCRLDFLAPVEISLAYFCMMFFLWLACVWRRPAQE